MKAIAFDTEAREEFTSAADYYEAQRAGLGDEFVDEVEKALQRIAQMPQAHTIYDSSTGMRKCLVRRFPYTIYFIELDDRIWIAAVAHQRRRPGYWAHREPG